MRSWIGVTLALWLVGCTTTIVQSEVLAVSHVSQCAAPKGASLTYNSLYLALGERPHAGYRAQLVSQLKDKDNYQIIFKEVQLPAQGPRQRVSPCLIIVMPKQWQQVWVINQSSGEQWHFEGGQ